MTHRTYIIRGSHPQAIGRELWREGSSIRLMYHVGNWPFPRKGMFDRAELVFVCGPAEIEAAPGAGFEAPAVVVLVEAEQVELI